MFTKKIILILTFCVIRLVTYGQLLDMKFSDPLQGKALTYDFATCIVQDSSGFIWIGTKNGLNCYDGYQVKKYLYEVADSTSLVNNTIKRLFVDSSGRIWIATMYGVCIYNKYFDNFIRVASQKDYKGLKSLQVSSIEQDKKGNIFVSAGNGIYRYNNDSATFSLIYKIEKGLVNNFIFDDNGNLWIGSSDEGGLIDYDPAHKKATKYLNKNNDNNSLSNNTISDLALLNNKLWIATYGGGINSFDPATSTFKRYPISDNYTGYVTYMYVDKDKNLWTCDFEGLNLYNRKEDSFYGYYTVEGDPTSVKKSIVAIIQDRQGNYWTIHSPGGVGLRTVPKGFLKYDKNPVNFWHTGDNNISAIAFDAEGNWWIGSGFNGIDIFNWKHDKIMTYHYVATDPYSLGKGGTMCLFRDRKQTMWIGTNLGGLQYYDKTRNKFYSFTNDPNDSTSIANNDIRSITEDKEGNLWVVTHGKGIDRFNRKHKKFDHYTNKKNNLSNDWAFQVLSDPDENLWVATAWGLSMLPKDSVTFKNYHYSASDTNTISNNQVNCLFEDSTNHLWVGTAGGLCKYNSGKDNFERINAGFTSNYICAIEEGNSCIWISTPKGISSYKPGTNEAFNFDERDGLINGQYLSRSAGKNDGDSLFFGGVGGLTVFRPGKLKYNTTPPDVYITELNLFYKPVQNYGENSVLKRNILYTDGITLNHRQNVISFSFIANNFINSEKNRYKYRMDGVDKGWVYTGHDHVAMYSHLNPGRYTFRVIASNNDDIWNKTGTFLTVRVKPPWWLTGFSKLAIAILAITIILMIIYLRTKSLNRLNIQLERNVEERTRDLHAKNKLLEEQAGQLNRTNQLLEKRQSTIEQQSGELMAQAEELKKTADSLEETNQELAQINATKDKLFSIIAHDLKNPFNVILGYTDLLINHFDDWPNNQKIEILNQVRESSGNAYNLLENLLNWSRSQRGTLDFNPVPVSVSESLQQVIQEVISFAKKKGVELKNEFSGDDLLIYADPNMLTLIFRNLLINAIKFSKPGGKVKISAKNSGHDSVCFSVSDHGVGMGKVKVGSLFNPENNISSNGTIGEKGTGLGLMLCKDFIDHHQGKIWAESQVNKGTTFYFTIPKA